MTALPAPEVAESALKERIAAGLEASRRRSLALTGAVDEHDLVRQHSPLMSPLVWDLAHIGNQEEQWLWRTAGGGAALRPEIDDVYDAFRHRRADRPGLPLLSPDDSRRYAHDVRCRVLDALDTVPLDGRLPLAAGGFVYGMVVQHEQQHDETMLATLQLRRGEAVLTAPPPPMARVGSLPEEVHVPAGLFRMGASGSPWALDNERPAHDVDVPAFWIDAVPVTNGAYLAFVEAGGYTDPRWWAPAGWAMVRERSLVAPGFWRCDAGQWLRTRLGRVEPVPADEPVQHVSWYEADAYARWAGRRLPTEAEWEKAGVWDPAAACSRTYPWGEQAPDADRANLGQRHLQPAPVGAYPAGVSAYGVHQMLGDVWEWTASDFRPYPGFRVFPYAEYSEVFFGPEHKVLRGGAWATDPVVCRATFRNWDYPVRRQIFAGFRTARGA